MGSCRTLVQRFIKSDDHDLLAQLGQLRVTQDRAQDVPKRNGLVFKQREDFESLCRDGEQEEH